MEQISSIATNKQPNDPYKITFRKIARAAAAEVLVHKKLAIITYVLYGVAMLLFAFNSYFYVWNITTGVNPAEFNPSDWGIVFTIIGIITTFFAVLNVFRDTSNQQLCDVGLALPIKAWERFFSKLMCLFIIQIAPYIVSVLGGCGIAVFKGSLQYDKLESDTAKTVFSMFFAGLAAILFIIAMTTLCSCCCGALAESAYFTFIMMFIINVLPLAFVGNILGTSAGFNNDVWYWLSDNNFGFDFRYWGFLYMFADYLDGMITRAAVGCGISIAVTLLSGIIYKKRDARSVGTPISSKLFFEIMMAGGCVTMFSLTFMSSEVMWGMLIAGVAYLIINIIVSRAKINALSFAKWIGKFAVTTAAFTVLVVISIKTGGFGYYSLRPDTVYLEDAKFRILCTTHEYYYHSPDTKIFITETLSPEQADEVMKICKKHIQKGIAEVNPFDIIFSNYDSPWIMVNGESDVLFGESRSPKFMFRKQYYTDEGRGGYVLSYSQTINISQKEMNALAEELRQLDYVTETAYSTLY